MKIIKPLQLLYLPDLQAVPCRLTNISIQHVSYSRRNDVKQWQPAMQGAGVPTPLTMCSAPLSTYRALDAWTPIRFLFLFFIKHVIRAIVTLIHVPDNMKQVLRPIFQLAKSRSGPISLGGEGRRRHESEEEKQGEATACRPHHRWSKCRPGSRWTDRGGAPCWLPPPQKYITSRHWCPVLFTHFLWAWNIKALPPTKDYGRM